MALSIFRLFTLVGEYTTLLLETIWSCMTMPPRFKLIRDHLFEIGVMSLPVVAITGFSTGMVLAAQSFFQLSDKGLAGATGLMVGKAMMVELGPLLTAFMITGRVGASMCAELGTMRVTEQIDALRSMAVNPVDYLIVPRFLASLFMVPILTIFSCIMGILGGFTVAVHLYGMPPHTFFDPMPLHIKWFDFFSGLTKSCFFGFLIVTISCFKGVTTQGGAAGVGRSTTTSVVTCYSCILISNFLLTIGLNEVYWLIAEWNQ